MTGFDRTNGTRSGDTCIRVVVLADDLLTRAGLRCLLGDLDEIEVVGLAADIEEATRLVDELQADVLVYGSLPAVEPSTQPARPVRRIILGDTDDPIDVETAFRAGADAFLLKSRLPEQLVAALRAVLAGHRFLDPEVGARLAATVLDGAEPQKRLTRRERDVLALLSDGRTNEEIADELGISARTVEGHRTQLGRKLGVRRRVELAEYALVHRLSRRRST